MSHLKSWPSKLLVFGLVSIILLPRIAFVRAQSVSGSKIAEAVASQLPENGSVVLLPVSNSRLDLSRALNPVMEETATALRARGYIVRTFEEAAVENAAVRTIGRSGLIGTRSISRFGGSLGIGLILLLALAEARQSEMSITASIYSSTNGIYDEIWRQRVGWKDEPKSNVNSQRPTSPCTRNLLVNGDFERDWSVGWSRAYSDMAKGGSVTEVVKGSNSHLLHMKHTGLSDVSLYQIVRVPKGRVVFQFQVKFHTWEGPIMGFSGTGTAGISLLLMDANQEIMGMVWAGNYVHNPFEGTGLVGVPHGPRDTSSASFLETPNDQTVRDRFDVTRFVRDRLGNVDINRIEYIGVNISVGATDQNAGAEAWVDNLSLEVCPTSENSVTPEQVSLSANQPLKVERVGENWKVRLNGSERWFDTGIRVQQGQSLTLSATGRVTWNANTNSTNTTAGPDGVWYNATRLQKPEDFPMPEARVASLLMRIGSVIYPVGAGTTVDVRESGTIQLMINDRYNGLEDNAGELIVLIHPSGKTQQ